MLLGYDTAGLGDGPGVAGEEQLVQIAFPLGLPCVDDLRVELFVVHRPVDGAEDADRLGEFGIATCG